MSNTKFERDDDDITFISQFLGDSHPNDFSVVKELLQNADDAKATRLDIVLHEGLPDPDAGPILNRAGILVLNDGDVEDQDLKALGNIQRTTKAQDESRIGRFGRGQKAVFRWADAFVALRLSDNRILTRLPRPLNTRRGDWRAVEAENLRRLFVAFGTDGDDRPPLNRGLALWLPLRQRTDCPPYVCQNFPTLEGVASDFEDVDDWLAASVSLCLTHVRLWSASTTSEPVRHFDLSNRHDDPQPGILRFPNGHAQCWRPPPPEGAEPPSHAGREISAHDLWPQQMQPSDDGTPAPVRQKSNDHAQVTIISRPVARGQGAQLSIRWAVRLPLDGSAVVEPTEISACDHHITVLLDGSFFLDSGRRAPLGINRPRHAGDIQDEGELKYAWNQAIRDDRLLPLVVPTLAEMAKKMPPDEMHRIVEALARTPLLEEPFKQPVLKKQRLVAALKRTGDGGLTVVWTAARYSDVLLPLDLPERTSLDVLAECFPNLAETTKPPTYVVDRDWSRHLGGEIDAARWHDQLNRLATAPDRLFCDPRHLSTALSIWEKNVAPLGDSQQAWLRNRRLDLARNLLQHPDWGPDVGAVVSKRDRWPAAKALFESVQDRIVVVDPSGFAVEFDALAEALAAERTGPPLLLLRKPKEDRDWSLDGDLHYAEDDACFDRLVDLAAAHVSSRDARARVLTAALQRVASEDRRAVLERPTIADTNLIQVSTGQQRWLSPKDLRQCHESKRVIKKWLSSDSQKPTLPDIRDCLPGLDIAEVREEPHPELARIILGEPLAELTPELALQWATSSRAFGGTAEQRCRFAKFLLMADVADIRPVRSVIAGRAVEHDARLFIGSEAAKPGKQDTERERIANARHLHDRIAVKNDRFLDSETSDVVRSMLTTNDFTRLLVEPTPEETLEAALDAELCATHWKAVAHAFASMDVAPRLAERLKKTAWLPLESGGAVAPADVLGIRQDVLDAVLALPGSARAELVLFERLSNALRETDSWRRIRSNLFLDERGNETLGLLFAVIEDFLDPPCPVLPAAISDNTAVDDLLRSDGVREVVARLQHLSPALQFVERLLALPNWDSTAVLLAAKDVMIGAAPDLHVLRGSLIHLEELASGDDSPDSAAAKWHLTICDHLRKRLPRDELQDLFATRMLPAADGTWRPTAQLVRTIASADGQSRPSQHLHEDWDSALFAERSEPDLAGVATLEPRRNSGAIDPRDCLSAKDVLPGLVRDLRPIASQISLAGLVIALAPSELESSELESSELESLARELLSESSPDEFGNLKKLLHKAQHERRKDDVKRMRLAFSRSEVSSDAEARTATSIVGHEVPLEQSDRLELFRRLGVEDPEKPDPEKPVLKRCVKDGDGYRWCLVVNAVDTRSWSEQETREAIQDAIKAIYNEVLGAFPTLYIERLQELASGAQTSVRVSQARILESMHLERIQSETLQGRLRKLRSSYESVVLGQIESDKSKSQQQQFEDHQRRIENHQQQLEETLRLISTDTDVANDLLRARRAGIERFDYAPGQILFELFQNADDALSQLLAALHPKDLPNDPEDLPNDQRLFIVWRTTNEEIAVAYGGRAINQVLIGGARIEHRGYDADLEHMCRLGSSSKGQKADTGQFGLGFKSVFLISSEPCIQSGSIGFALLGGMLPFEDEARWRPQTQRFYEKACRRLPYATKTTTIVLPQTTAAQREGAKQAFDAFKARAALLPFFAKAIRRVEVIDEDDSNEGPPFQFPAWQVDDRSDCVHTMSHPGVRYLGLSSAPLADGDGWRLAMELRHDLPAKLSDHLCGLWNVAPTAEGKTLGFALNGPIQLDAGRGSIARNRTHDLSGLQRAGRSIGLTVLSAFAEKGVDWWTHFWSVFDAACSEIDRPQDAVAELLLAFLGGDEHVSGLLRLLAAQGRLPNGLDGDLAALTSPDQILYVIADNALPGLTRFLELKPELHVGQFISKAQEKILISLGVARAKQFDLLTRLGLIKQEIVARPLLDQGDLRRLDALLRDLGPIDRNKVIDELRNARVRTREGRDNALREVVVPWSDHHGVAPNFRAVDGPRMERLERLRECFKEAGPTELGQWIVEAPDRQRRLHALRLLASRSVKDEGLLAAVQRKRDDCWLKELRNRSAFEEYRELRPTERDFVIVAIWGPQVDVTAPASTKDERKPTESEVDNNLKLLDQWWSQPSQAARVEEAQELKAVDLRKRVDLRIGVYAAVGLSPSELTEVLGKPKHGDFDFTWFKLLCALNALGAWPFDWDKAVKFIDSAHRKGVFDSIWNGEGEEARTKALNDLFSTDSDSTNYWRHLLDFEKLAALIDRRLRGDFAERLLSEARSVEGRHTVARVAHLGKAPGVPARPAPRSSLKKYVFLLLRELHRLGVAPNQPHGFFPSNRVLQLCHRLGLVDNDKVQTDFDQLCDQVAGIVEQLDQHDELTQLRKWRDAPFFAYAKTMCERFEGCERCEMVCPMKDPRRRATANGARPSS